MRSIVTIALISTLSLAAATPAEDPPTQPVGSISDLMVKILYPASDAILYISSRTPETEVEWNVLQGQALMLAETANLLMMPSRSPDLDQWIKDAKIMLDAGTAAYEAALAKDVDRLIELNDMVYQSCLECHNHYHPVYRRAKAAGIEADELREDKPAPE